MAAYLVLTVGRPMPPRAQVRASPDLLRQVMLCVQTFHLITREAHGDCMLDNMILYKNVVTGREECRLIDLQCTADRTIANDVFRMSMSVHADKKLRDNAALIALVDAYVAAEYALECMVDIIEFLASYQKQLDRV